MRHPLLWLLFGVLIGAGFRQYSVTLAMALVVLGCVLGCLLTSWHVEVSPNVTTAGLNIYPPLPPVREEPSSKDPVVDSALVNSLVGTPEDSDWPKCYLCGINSDESLRYCSNDCCPNRPHKPELPVYDPRNWPTCSFCGSKLSKVTGRNSVRVSWYCKNGQCMVASNQ